jgi:hypothetical protein
VLDKLGSITAYCEVDMDNKSMRVGFSFLSPLDKQLPARGKGLAKQCFIHTPIEITNLQPADKPGRLRVTEALVNYLKGAKGKSFEDLCSYLCVEPYNGQKEPEFMRWFPAMLEKL